MFLGFACGRCNVEVTSAAIFFFWMGRFMEKSGKRRLPKTWALTTLLSEIYMYMHIYDHICIYVYRYVYAYIYIYALFIWKFYDKSTLRVDFLNV